MRSLIDIVDFSVAELDELIQTACDISENPQKYSQIGHFSQFHHIASF